MLETVKKALRISHDALNDDILLNIEAARAEGIRAGVPVEVMNDENNALVTSFIRTYCMYAYADKDNAPRFLESYTYQLENLRKSLIYIEGVM